MAYTSIKALWNSLKESHPEHIILIQIGAFFEAYQEDAEYLFENFDFRVFKRHDWNVVGFPINSIEKYIIEIEKNRELLVVKETQWDQEGKKREMSYTSNSPTMNKLASNPKPLIEQELQDLLIKRQLIKLFHFTHIKNLISIAQNGLLTRKTLEELEIKFQETDPDRLDGIIDSISLSISKPNYWLLRSKQFQFRNELVVIELPATLLANYPFIAFPSNAARTDLKKMRENNPNDFLGATGLENLFTNDELRRDKAIPVEEPTDLQAEIMVTSNLPPALISKVHIHPQHLERLKQEEGSHSLLLDIKDFLHENCDCSFFNEHSKKPHDGRKFEPWWKGNDGK